MGNEFFDAGEFEFELEKSKFIKNIDYLKSMSAEEQTFYKKWVEVQTYKDYLNKLSGKNDIQWRFIDSETLELKEFPNEGFIIKEDDP